MKDNRHLAQKHMYFVIYAKQGKDRLQIPLVNRNS